MTIINRRKFLGTSAGGLGLLGLTGAMPDWARGANKGTLARKGSDGAVILTPTSLQV